MLSCYNKQKDLFFRNNFSQFIQLPLLFVNKKVNCNNENSACSTLNKNFP